MSRILIVEDETHLAHGLRFNLEAEGHEVDLSETGEDALARITADPRAYALVVLDVMLPGIDGFNFLLRQALGGGGMASLKADPLAKAFAQMLLDMPVKVPASVAREVAN